MKYLFTFILEFICIAVLAQTENDKKIFMDSLWRETTDADYKYYRIIKDYHLEKESYVFFDMYKSGALYSKTTSKTKDYMSKEGKIINYYENGNKKKVENYVKGRINGAYFEWYENGNKKIEGEYMEDIKLFTSELKINQFWNNKNEQTVFNGNGDFEENNLSIYGTGKVKSGFKDGEWKGKDKILKYTYTEFYENQKLVSGTSIDSVGGKHDYKFKEIRPVPKKGIESFYKYVGKNFNAQNIPKGISGKIFIQFIVDKEGKIVEPKILKHFGYGADEEGIRLFNEYPELWIPGKIRGIKMRSVYTLPIIIQSPN